MLQLTRYNDFSLPSFFSLLFCFVLIDTCFSQNVANKDFEKVEKFLAEAVSSKEVVGHCGMVYCNGEVVYRNRWGLRDREKNLPVESDTIFRIYSMTKPITSLAAMQLVEKGKLDLDKPVKEYLAEFADLKVLDGENEILPRRDMLVRDLMRHTSGLTYGFFGNSKVDKAYRREQIMIFDKNIEQMVSKLGKIPLLNQPGQRFHYSISTDVLGRLIEVVSGKRFGEYLDENIFGPLNMKDTFFTVPHKKLNRLAQMYRGQGANLKPVTLMESYRYLNENDFESGGGGLCSTMDDYLQFCKMLLARGELDGNKILGRELIDQMFTNQLENIEEYSSSFQFGLGFRISSRGDYGWGGIAGTRFWVNPEKQTAIIYMTQINPYRGRQWANRFRDMSYEILNSK